MAETTGRTGGEVCPHKKWNLDRNNKATCPLCGEERQYTEDKNNPYIVLKEGKVKTEKNKTKPGRDRTANYERHRFYEKNKGDIVQDLITYGRHFTMQKWNMASSTLHSCEKRWLTNVEVKLVDVASGKSGSPLDKGQPMFPPFNDNWETPVQLKWLEIFEKLMELRSANANKT